MAGGKRKNQGKKPVFDEMEDSDHSNSNDEAKSKKKKGDKKSPRKLSKELHKKRCSPATRRVRATFEEDGHLIQMEADQSEESDLFPSNGGQDDDSDDEVILSQNNNATVHPQRRDKNVNKRKAKDSDGDGVSNRNDEASTEEGETSDDREDIPDREGENLVEEVSVAEEGGTSATATGSECFCGNAPKVG